MFYVLNKDKLISFLVAASTVCVLFMMTTLFAKTPQNTIETASTNKQLPIYSVDTRRKKSSINNELCLE